MDNGLIIPYPLVCANAESLDTNAADPLGFLPFGGGLGGDGADLMG